VKFVKDTEAAVDYTERKKSSYWQGVANLKELHMECARRRKAQELAARAPNGDCKVCRYRHGNGCVFKKCFGFVPRKEAAK